ncbi:MAG: glycosyltransferase family 4 protein [Clostridiaceae bacterium]|nr:glycosyltransferase family 4 protein [Clostridiaceae bacterium]
MIGHKRIPSREGGVEIVVHELATRMVLSGHRVDAYNRAGHPVSGEHDAFDSAASRKEYRGIRIITIPTFQTGSLNALVYSLLATLRALFGQYDVIHYHAEGPCAMIWIPHLLRMRTVATIHGLDWQRSKWGGLASKYLKFGERIAARYADELIVLSKNVQNYFLSEYGRTAEYIPNGIARCDKRDDTVIRNKYGLTQDSYILFLARIVPEKGLHYLIDAFQKIDTGKKLVIAGGSSHTDDYLSAIRQKASEDPRIVMTGFIQGDELESIFSNAYLYVLPSDVEGMPISLLEAMSYGNCCLVSDIAENAEVVGERAVCFRRGDVIDLAEKMSWLLENPDIAHAFRQSASAYICSKYNWDDVVEKTVKLYKHAGKADKKT